MDVVNAVALKGICANYFESHVSPVLKYIQQSQEQISDQLQELRRTLELKANKGEVPTLEDVAKGCQAGGPSVSTQVRLKELTALVQRKADISSVATLAQFNRLVAAVEQKASAKEAVTAAQAAQLLAALERKANADAVPSLAQFRELAEVVERRPAAEAGPPQPQALQALRAELAELRAAQRAAPAPAPSAGPSAEVRKVQVVVAAAGARFDRQLKELRQQLRELRAEPRWAPPAEGAEERWPGRRLDAGPPAALSDAASESDVASLAGSLASCSGSLAGLGAEERAELKRIQAVVGVAGTTFSRELRDLRSQLRALQAELQSVREALGDRAAGGSSGHPDGKGRARTGR